MHVVIGLIVNTLNRVLITQRPLTKPLGGLWEFPGGKIEPGEDKEQALYREISEEVGLTILSCTYFDEIPGEPMEKGVPWLYVYWVTKWVGEAKCLENQMGLAWVCLSDLDKYAFPKANQSIVKKLQELVYAQ